MTLLKIGERMIGKMIGDKISIREMTLADWEDVHAYASMDVVCEYQPWGPNTEEESFEFVKLVLNDHDKNPRTRFVFAVLEKGTERIVGSGEINIKDSVNKEAEISYIIHPNYWGAGHATDTGILLLKFGFSKLQLHRIYATCDPRNGASARVLEKIGMEKEGLLRENVLLRDGWRDSYLFSMLEQDWEK